MFAGCPSRRTLWIVQPVRTCNEDQSFTQFVPIKDHPAALKDARSLALIQSSAEVLLSVAPERTYADFAIKPPETKTGHRDALGDLIRRKAA